MALPDELWDEILNYLADDNDVWTLASCARACNVLYPIAQSLFFRHVVLWCPLFGDDIPNLQHTSTPTQFMRLIDCAPHISGYVRDLDVCATFTMKLVCNIYVEGECRALEMVLRRLHNVSRISFPREPGLRQTIIRWSSMDNALKVLILKIFTMDRIREINTGNLLRFPATEILRTTPLKKLTLGNLDSDTPTKPSLPFTKFQVDILALQGITFDKFVRHYRWLADPRCQLDGNTVQRLEIRDLRILGGANSDAHALNKIFRVLPNVTSLNLTSHCSELTLCNIMEGELYETPSHLIHLPPPQNLTFPPRLTTLTFEGEFYSLTRCKQEVNDRIQSFRTCIESLHNILQTLSVTTPNQIHTINIVIGMIFPDYYRSSPHFFIENVPELSRWTDIVDILLSERLPSLRRVKLDIRAPNGVTKEEKTKWLNIIESFPQIERLKARELL